jgi:hypothetical protein
MALNQSQWNNLSRPTARDHGAKYLCRLFQRRVDGIDKRPPKAGNFTPVA